MKRLKSFLSVLGFSMMLISPVLIGIALSAISGTSTDVGALGVFGPNATFTCEYVSDDGNQCLLATAGGSRRFVDLGERHALIEVGRQYHVERHMLHRFAAKSYLVPI